MSKGETAQKPDKYDDWAVQNAVDVLTRAEEIKQDDKMMKLVDEEVEKRKEALSKIKPSSAEIMYGKNEEKKE